LCCKYDNIEEPELVATESSVVTPDVDAGKRVPLDTLARLFPQVKRTLLKTTLDKSDGDVLKAIEQLVYSQNNNPAVAEEQEASVADGAHHPPAPHQPSKRKSTDQQPRQQPHRFSNSSYLQHHDSSAAAGTLPWKAAASGQQHLPGNGTPVGSFARPPLFSLHQSGYFPAAAAAAAFANSYGASAAAANSFLSSANFLRPDYPVFPGMNSMLSGSAGLGSGLESSIINPAYAAYHHQHPGASLLIQQQVVKQENSSTSSDLGLMGHRSPSPRSDRSDQRSPYSD